MKIDISRSHIFPRSHRAFTPINTGNHCDLIRDQ